MERFLIMRFNSFVARCIAYILFVMILVPFTFTINSYAADQKVFEPTLRVRVGDKIVLGEADLRRMTFTSDTAATAAFRKNIIALKRGQNIQLRVELVDARGKVSDITRNSAVTYESVSPWKLTVTADGIVSMTGSEGASLNPLPSGVGDSAVFILYSNGSLRVWNKVFFSNDF